MAEPQSGARADRLAITLPLALLIVLALLPLLAHYLPGERYVIGLFARVMIFAIAAISLDLILGYGGLVSFGHAAFLGLGAYAVGILAAHGITDVLSCCRSRLPLPRSSRSPPALSPCVRTASISS